MPRYIFLLAFVFGAGCLVLLPVGIVKLAQVGFIYLSLICLALVLARLTVLRRGFLSQVVLTVASFCLGFCLNLFQVVSVVGNQLPAAFEGQDISVKVIVTGLPKDSGRSYIFDVLAEESGSTSPVFKRAPTKLRLSWYKEREDIAVPRVGSIWMLTVRLKRPRGVVNPGGFDFQAWLLAQGYAATGYIRAAKPLTDHAIDVSVVDHLGIYANQGRQYLIQKLFDRPLTHSGILKALVLGDKSGISAESWHVLQQFGCVCLFVCLFVCLCFFVFLLVLCLFVCLVVRVFV